MTIQSAKKYNKTYHMNKYKYINAVLSILPLVPGRDLGLSEAHGRWEPLGGGGVGGSFGTAAYAIPTC